MAPLRVSIEILSSRKPLTIYPLKYTAAVRGFFAFVIGLYQT